MLNLVPCDTCPAPCCRKLNVDVLIPDIHRISRGLHLSAAHFTELLWLEEAEPHRRICLAPNGRYYRLRLKRVPDVGDEMRCVFLLPVHEQRAICGIYHLRPEICRTYPSYLEGGGVVATSGGKACPENAWSIEKMNVRQLRADWVLKHRFHAIHDELVDGWNERVFFQNEKLTEGDFHGFMTSACTELEAVAPTIFDRPPAGAPFAPGDYPPARIAELVDRVLRVLGWRTDETVAFRRPEIGRGLTSLPMAPPDGPEADVIHPDDLDGNEAFEDAEEDAKAAPSAPAAG